MIDEDQRKVVRTKIMKKETISTNNWRQKVRQTKTQTGNNNNNYNN